MFKAAKTVDFLFLTYYTDGSKQRKRLSSLIRLYFPLYLSRRSVSFSALRTERPINFLCRRRAAEWMIVMEKFDSLIIGEVAQDTNVDFDGTVVQAVGGAVGHNDISLIIPCHRVVNSRGSTAPGWDGQRNLLENEGVPFHRNGRVVLERCLWQPDGEPPDE